MLDKVVKICHAEFRFDTFLEVMEYFKQMINVFKQMNYSEYESDQFKKFNDQLDAPARRAHGKITERMATKSISKKIYTKITQITKATCSLKATELGMTSWLP